MSTAEQKSKQPAALTDRNHLTFEQAEGVEQLPQQLRLRELSPAFRAAAWNVVLTEINRVSFRDPLTNSFDVTDPWLSILKNRHIYRLHRPADEFSALHRVVCAELKPLILAGDYVEVLGFLQFVIRHRNCPRDFAEQINECLEFGQVAYRVIDQTIHPLGSEAEIQAVQRSFADLAKTEFNGARTHLRNAAEELTAGHYAGSVRESIHAVESVARVLEPSAELSKALSELEKSTTIHGAMKKGFLAIYGYTSDEQGVRHALLEAGAPTVDETDALFMIGACASFVSYMINKARKA